MSKKTIFNITTFALIGILLVAGIFLFGGQTLGAVAPVSGSYIEVPIFAYYKCEPAAGLTPITTPSTGIMLSTGETNGYITVPSNAYETKITIEITESRNLLSELFSARRIVYQICRNKDNNQCEPEKPIDVAGWMDNGIKVSYTIPETLSQTDMIKIKYQAFGLISWSNKANAAKYYFTYTPFVINRYDIFAGALPYTSTEEGCTVKPKANEGLLLSLSGTVKDSIINQQISTQSLKNTLLFNEIRTYITGFVPISKESIKIVTYNGQQGYCMNNKIYKIASVTTTSGSYKIVDTTGNVNSILNPSVQCCPGEVDASLNRKCSNSFVWVNIEEAECSYFNPCASTTYIPNTPTTKIKYDCINSKCVADVVPVECASNSACPSSKPYCDLKTFTCYAGNVGGTTTGNVNLTCNWYEQEYIKTSKDYGLLYWRFFANNPIVNNDSGCKIADWVIVLLIGLIGAAAIYYYNTKK